MILISGLWGLKISSLTGGAGNDVLTGGAGVDTFVRNGDGTTDGVDVVTDFTAGNGGDIIDLTTSAAAGTGITAGNLMSGVNLNGTGGAADIVDGGFVTIADNAATLDAAGIANVATAGANDLTVNVAADNVFYIAVDNGVDTVIALVTADTAGTAIVAADVTVIMTLTGVSDATSLTAANFADFI